MTRTSSRWPACPACDKPVLAANADGTGEQACSDPECINKHSLWFSRGKPFETPTNDDLVIAWVGRFEPSELRPVAWEFDRTTGTVTDITEQVHGPNAKSDPKDSA